MKNGGSLTLKIFALIVMNDLVDSIVQVLFKKGLIHTGITNVNFGNLVEFILRNVSSPLVLLGIFIGLSNYFLWFVILSRVDLSVAMPLGSIIYIFIPFMAILFLHERVSPLRWLAIILIIAGIYLVAKSKELPKGAA